MEASELSAFQKELDELAEKWGLQNCAFCGNGNDNQFIGTSVGVSTVSNIWATVLNVGRLWQHHRTEVRQILNEYDKSFYQEK